jgi:hypothetical protein
MQNIFVLKVACKRTFRQLFIYLRPPSPPRVFVFLFFFNSRRTIVRKISWVISLVFSLVFFSVYYSELSILLSAAQMFNTIRLVISLIFFLWPILRVWYSEYSHSRRIIISKKIVWAISLTFFSLATTQSLAFLCG